MNSSPRRWRRVDGVLLLDKPAGISSNAALQRARRLFAAGRAGHSGTLDPMASGLLVVCFGEATKFSGELLEAEKTYVARVRFGERTSTGDAEGEIVERREASFSRVQLADALGPFRGETFQVPPMYSALKRGGRALYEYARRGISVERAPRSIVVHELELGDFSGAEATLRLRCSKGTYVRALAEDIGEALSCGAHLKVLVRQAVGEFSIAQAHRIEELEALSEAARDELLLPVDALLRPLPRLQLSSEQQAAFMQGRAQGPFPVATGRMRVYGTGAGFLGLGWVDAGGRLHPKRLVSAS